MSLDISDGARESSTWEGAPIEDSALDDPLPFLDFDFLSFDLDFLDLTEPFVFDLDFDLFDFFEPSIYGL